MEVEGQERASEPSKCKDHPVTKEASVPGLGSAGEQDQEAEQRGPK